MPGIFWTLTFPKLPEWHPNSQWQSRDPEDGGRGENARPCPPGLGRIVVATYDDRRVRVPAPLELSFSHDIAKYGRRPSRRTPVLIEAERLFVQPLSADARMKPVNPSELREMPS
jgi:hypothetical protein